VSLRVNVRPSRYAGSALEGPAGKAEWSGKPVALGFTAPGIFFAGQRVWS